MTMGKLLDLYLDEPDADGRLSVKTRHDYRTSDRQWAWSAGCSRPRTPNPDAAGNQTSAALVAKVAFGLDSDEHPVVRPYPARWSRLDCQDD